MLNRYISTMTPTKKPLTWLITGSSNGIGLALTRQVISSGDNVIATSRNPSKTPDLVHEIKSSPRGQWMALDVSWPLEQIKNVVRKAETLFDGGIDVVVNNAAFCVLGAVEDITEDEAKAQFETNVWGPLRICKAVLPFMRQRGRGAIVNDPKKELLILDITVNGGAMRSIDPSDPYKSPHTVAASLQNEYDKNGKQPGDPVKACKMVYDAVTGTDGRLANVLRLPLGTDAWEISMAHFAKMRDEFEACKEVACSVHVDE